MHVRDQFEFEAAAATKLSEKKNESNHKERESKGSHAEVLHRIAKKHDEKQMPVQDNITALLLGMRGVMFDNKDILVPDDGALASQ